MNKITKNFMYLLLFLLIQSCVNLRNARRFKPVDSKQFTYLPEDKMEYPFPEFSYLEKDITDKQSKKVGEFIVQVYENSNEQILFSGILVPFFPTFFINFNAFPNDYEVLSLGLNFYDSCHIYGNLNKNSFMLQINDNKDDLIYCESFYKNKRDCQMKIIEKADSVKYSITYFFNSTKSISRIKNIKLIPVDENAKQIIDITKLKKKRKIYLEYIFKPR
jgi:hypothetical protein